jgi:hypothetical protein
MTREPARDTLAPSSFGVIGGTKPQAPAPAPVRNPRAPLPTLGDLDGATATATLRPPGAVPPPPRALPMPTPNLEAASAGSPIETPLPTGADGNVPFTPLAGDLAPVQRTPPARAAATAPAGALAAPGAAGTSVVSAAAPTAPAAELESTLDMSGTASKKATQAALIEQTRISAPSGVPAPGLYIADEPLEPRPKQQSLVSAQRELLTRMRIVVLVLGGLLLMLAGAVVVLVFRRSEATAARAAAPAASSPSEPPGCHLALPPSRISPTIERSVPISAVLQSDGSIALGIADQKNSAAGWIFDPTKGEAVRKLPAPPGTGDVSHVSAGEPMVVDRSTTDFAFGQTLSPGLALGVGPAGVLRRGDDGATGVVWSLPAGVRVTAPRVVALAGGYFVAFRQGGSDGKLKTGWLRADGTASGELSAVEGVPKSLGTPNVAQAGKDAIVMLAARNDKSEPYFVVATRVALGEKPRAPKKLELPAEGGGAIAPSLAQLGDGRFLAQWTDGSVGQYRVHTRLLDENLAPLGEALLVSAKGANAGPGTLLVAPSAIVSFFIQTTAGHDELWGAPLSCR